MDHHKLTRKVVDSAKAGASDYFLWDQDLKGFGLKVTRGGRKVYVVQYRMGGRGFPTRRRTIGADGSPWTPSTARGEAERVLHLVGLGHDPAIADREQERDQLHGRFEQLAGHFVEDGKRNWAARTYFNRKSDIERWLLPVLGKKTLNSIGRRDITAVLDRIPGERPARPATCSS